MKQLRRPSLLSPSIFCGNANALFSVAKYFLRYPGYAIWKLMSGRFWKRDGFLCYNFFKLELLLFKVWSNLKKCDSESGGVTKINTQSILRFLRSSWEKFLNGIYKLHQFWPHLTPLAIHRWKAMDLRFNLAPSFRDLKHPTSRQNFYDTLEQTPMVDLRNLSRESLQGTHQARDCAKPK